MKSTQQKLLSAKDFDTVKELGFGSFGKVFLVKHKQNNQQYAMKSISLSRIGQKEREAALNQVRLLASISVPNIIHYEGSFYNSDQQTLCIIMEFADGGDLEHKILDKEGQFRRFPRLVGFDQKNIWKVAFQILSGLKTLHQNNIIHRDIKSANIFFVKGVAKLGDLNISKITDNGFCSTQTGTPYYTSPQIWNGETYNNKCDIWALGCIIYQMATLKHPFKAHDYPSLYKKVVSGEYPEIQPAYSHELKIFIRMCLTADPTKRPSAAQLLQTKILSGMELSLEKSNKPEGQINLIDPIICPKVLRFLNSKLPQPQKTLRQDKKKAVNFFGSKQEDLFKFNQTSEVMRFKHRKMKSEKVISSCVQTLSAWQSLKNTSKKNILPLQKQTTNNLANQPLKFSHTKKANLQNTPKSINFNEKRNEPKSMKCITMKNKQNSKF